MNNKNFIDADGRTLEDVELQTEIHQKRDYFFVDSSDFLGNFRKFAYFSQK